MPNWRRTEPLGSSDGLGRPNLPKRAGGPRRFLSTSVTFRRVIAGINSKSLWKTSSRTSSSSPSGGSSCFFSHSSFPSIRLLSAEITDALSINISSRFGAHHARPPTISRGTNYLFLLRFALQPDCNDNAYFQIT